MTADDWIKLGAVIVGGIWTWVNYVRGRTFRKRLDIELPGSVAELGGVKYFRGECRAKNVGSSHIPILKYGTGVTIFTLWLVKSPRGEWTIVEREINALDLVSKDAWIEPGETFSKPYIMTLPASTDQFVGMRTEAMINNGSTVWTVSCITDGPKLKKEEPDDE